MGKIFGMLLIVAGIWVGLEVFQKGPGGAFDGAFASVLGAEPQAADEPATTQDRAGSSVDRAHRDTEQRWDRMLGE